MPIEISTPDFKFAYELKKTAPPGVVVKVHERFTRSADALQTVIVILEFVRDKSIDLDLGLLAAWLYDKSQNRDCYIHKGRKEILNTQLGIRDGIEEELRIGHND